MKKMVTFQRHQMFLLILFIFVFNGTCKVVINSLFYFRAVTEFVYRAGSNTLIPILVEEGLEHKGWIGVFFYW